MSTTESSFTSSKQTVVLKVSINRNLAKNLEKQADGGKENGYSLCSSFVLNDYVVNVYQKN